MSAGDADFDGAELLDRVMTFLKRFVAFPSESAAVAVALWTVHCHLVEEFESTPRLALLSPEPGSGKTRTLEIIELLVPHPMHVLSASPAAIFRSIAVKRPTLLLDEVDTVFARRGKDDSNEDLRGLLNAGHRRGATIPRCVGPNQEVRFFKVHTAVALAGLGDLPDTLMARSIIIRMRRRAPGELVQPYRSRIHRPAGEELRNRLATWADRIRLIVQAAWPKLPDGVEDRPADCWEPLLAIADAAGGRWPETARSSCLELLKVAESRQASLGVRLLSDLRIVFGDRDSMSTAQILAALAELPESPWSELRGGKPLGDRGLARMLDAYGIKSKTVRVDDKTPRGYEREPLWDAWQRYLPPPPAEAQRVQRVQQPSSDPLSPVADSVHVSDASATSARSATGVEPLSCPVALVAEVVDLRGPRTAEPCLGPCNQCGRLTRRYGEGGSPLCVECRARAVESAAR